MTILDKITVQELITIVLTLGGVSTMLFKLKKYNDRMHDNAKKQEEINKRVEAHEEQLANLDAKLSDYIELSNRRSRTHLKQEIKNQHAKFMRQKYVSDEDYEIFAENCRNYELVGGNGVVKNKYKPDVEALPIRSGDEVKKLGDN